MKNVKFILTMVLAVVIAGLYLESCKKDSGPGPLNLVSLKTDGGIALDGATAATGVPLNASIIATFDKAIDPNSLTGSVALQIGTAAVATTVTASGTTVTIKPNADMPTGVAHTVILGSTLKATDGGPFTAGGNFTFTSFGRAVVTAPQAASQLSYFPFSGNLNDAVAGSNHTPGANDKVTAITYGTDRFGFAGLAASFDGSTSIAEIPNGDGYLVGPDFTISFWIKAAYPATLPKDYFVLGLGAWKGFQFEIAGDWTWVKLASQYAEAGGLSDSEDNWFPGSGQTKDNGGWQGWTFQKNVPNPPGVGVTYFGDKWCHVVCTFQSSTKLVTMYLNGEKVKQHDFNLWPAGDKKATISSVKFAGNTTGGGNKLALGFIQATGNPIITDSWAQWSDPTNNHYKGLMDDLRIWKAALTASEVTSLYAAEKP